VSDQALDDMIEILKRHHPTLDFRPGLASINEPLDDPLSRIPARLFAHDLIRPAETLDLALVIEAGKTRQCQHAEEFANPKRLEWWLKHIGWRFLGKWLPAFKELPDYAIAGVAQGINRALEKYWYIAHLIPNENAAEGEAWNRKNRFPASLAKELEPFFHELFSRLDRAQDDQDLLWMCCRFAFLAYENNTPALDPARRKRLLQLARDELGKLRTLTRNAQSPEARAEADRRRGFYDDALMYICAFGSIWMGLKPLVLAMRSLNSPCVPPDLWYWSERKGEKTPYWSWLPNFASGVVHHHSRLEEEQDPRLESLRNDFAEFCLERLKSKDGKLVEPSAHWRYGYVRALQDLRMNPRGHGHHVLHHVQGNDPDSAVKDAAKAAYNEMRHGEDLPENRSPRRAILGALFWIRRAHFIELEGQEKLDETGALRTRNREGRRTDLGTEDRMKR
jgi:hypothetical protein